MTDKLDTMTPEEIDNDMRLQVGVTIERFSRHLLQPYDEKTPTDYTDSLDPLADAVTILEWLEDELPRLVNDARQDGASWARIGERLGMTRQAAWERFAE